MRVGMWVVVHLGAAAACGGEPAEPPRDPITLETARAWPGGRAAVRAAWLAQSRDVQIAVGDRIVATPVRQGDSLVFTTPSDLRAGGYPVAVTHDGVRDVVGSLQLGGYDRRLEGPPVAGIPLAWPPGSPVGRVLAHGPEGLLDIDLRFGTSRQLVAYSDIGRDYACMWGPGPSLHANEVVFCGYPVALWPTVAVDSSRWWASYRGIGRYAEDGAVQILSQDLVSTHGEWRSGGARRPVASPDGRRMAVLLNDAIRPLSIGAPAGYPVFGPDGIAFVVADSGAERLFRAAAFSAGGDTLFLAFHHVGPEPGGDTLLVLGAESGNEYARYPLPCGPWTAGGTDAGLVLVCGPDRVVVLEPEDGRVLGDIQAPPEMQLRFGGNLVVSSPAEGAFYVVAGETLSFSWPPPSARLTIFRFVLP